MKVPDKYLELNAAFQKLKCTLHPMGVKVTDVEGVLTGNSEACVGILHQLFFAPKRTDLATHLLTTYGLAPTNSEFKLVSAVFRIARAEFGLLVKLSVEQFLNGGSFTLKKIEFLTDVAAAVSRRVGLGDKRAISTNESKSRTLLQADRRWSMPAVVGEEEKPETAPRPTSASHDDDTEEKLHRAIDVVMDGVESVQHVVGELAERIAANTESLEARLAIIEGRLRIWEKVGGGGTIPQSSFLTRQ